MKEISRNKRKSQNKKKSNFSKIFNIFRTQLQQVFGSRAKHEVSTQPLNLKIRICFIASMHIRFIFCKFNDVCYVCLFHFIHRASVCKTHSKQIKR